METRAYEAMIILKSGGTEAEMAQAVAAAEEPIKRIGRVINSASWGRRRLTYRIGKQAEGHYQLVEFEIAPGQLTEVKRALTLNEHIVRFMILSRDEAAQPAAAAS